MRFEDWIEIESSQTLADHKQTIGITAREVEMIDWELDARISGCDDDEYNWFCDKFGLTTKRI